MAKGLRASTKKANRTQLRSLVFGPVEEARKERLSAKLLEVASKPQLAVEEEEKMADDRTGEGICLCWAIPCRTTDSGDISSGGAAEGSSTTYGHSRR